MKKDENQFVINLIKLLQKYSDAEFGYSGSNIVQAGYRHIDCARVYGNEKEVTIAITSVFFYFKRINSPALWSLAFLLWGISNVFGSFFNVLQIGIALKELFSTGAVKRSEMFITSKLWYLFSTSYFSFGF